ncbi:MAG: hypothetical protein MUO26_05385 [Methanotrichaceae archaeon]|nr:hypothetical protein [Methanotrichaceae archaeon]
MSTRLVYADDHPLKKIAPQLPDTPPSEPVAYLPKTIEVIFKTNEHTIKKGLSEDLDVFPFCERQCKKLKDLVDECEKRFNKPPSDPCEERK